MATRPRLVSAALESATAAAPEADPRLEMAAASEGDRECMVEEGVEPRPSLAEPEAPPESAALRPPGRAP